MIALPSGVQVWLAAGVTDLRKGFDGLSALVQLQLAEDPFSGQLFLSLSKSQVIDSDHRNCQTDRI
jgi:transposase